MKHLTVSTCAQKRAKIIAAALTAISIGVIAAQPSFARNGDPGFRGVIISRPAGGNGVWTVGGAAFYVTNSTELDGVLETGACVKVRYVNTATQSVALEIEREPASDCSASASASSSASASASPSASSTPGATATSDVRREDRRDDRGAVTGTSEARREDRRGDRREEDATSTPESRREDRGGGRGGRGGRGHK